MQLHLAYVSPRRDRLKSSSAQALLEDYLGRAQRYSPIALASYRSEDELVASAAQRSGRAQAIIILLDSRGRSLSSTQFAELLRSHRDAGAQGLTMAIGPPDGWSAAARKKATMLLSLSSLTLPHELALVLLAEQTYRALTILAGHPYHSGHE